MQAILLGSGLGQLVDHFQIVDQWSYSDFTDYKIQQLDGHERIVYKAAFAECECMILSGKLHAYESYSHEQLLRFYESVCGKFGIDSMVVTASSGALTKEAKVGHWYQVNGIINASGIRVGGRQNQLSKSTTEFGALKSLIYGFQSGPNLGSLAEYNMLYWLGAQLVGMSLLPEYHVLKELLIETTLLSLPVCNYAPLNELIEPTHQEVINVANKAVIDLARIYKTHVKSNL